MKPYKKFKYDTKVLRNSEKISKGIFSLPLYPELKHKDVILICKKIKNFHKV